VPEEGECRNPALPLLCVQSVPGGFSEAREELVDLVLQGNDPVLPVDRGGVEASQLRGARLKISVSLAQQPLAALTVRDVARDLGCSDDDSRLVAYRRYGERDVQATAVSGDPVVSKCSMRSPRRRVARIRFSSSRSSGGTMSVMDLPIASSGV